MVTPARSSLADPAAGLSDAASHPLQRGSAEFRRVNGALFAAGFATFTLLYCVQPLMPSFAAAFSLSPAMSSLSLSLTTLLLAPAMVVTSSLSEVWGRKRVMSLSLLLSAALTLLAAAAPDWPSLLVCRTLLGITLSGMPAVSMAYLSEEVEANVLGYAMGLFIGGSAFGGMVGRVATAGLADLAGWRVAVAGIGVIGLAATLVFWRSLPASRRFRPRPFAVGPLWRSLFGHVADRGLPRLFLMGFLLMGSFVAVYNYTGFRLLAPPFALSQAAAGAIFTVYLIGMVGSTWVGALAGRLGQRHLLWATVLLMLAGLALTLSDRLALVVAGVALFTFGFFGGHSLASAWVGRRAQQARAQASALYLFSYYLGSSIAGSLGGLFWQRAGWPGVALMVGTLLVAALTVALWLVRLPPLASDPGS
jgi:MFS transporter, YNFM family, putative membrane transport protein